MTEPLWTLGELVTAAPGVGDSASATPVSAISIDSRSIEAGDAYVAIKGLSQDGHAFVPDAFSRGAACAIVEQAYTGGESEAQLIRVEDTLEALNGLGRAARARAADTQIIAVTGSAGKTGTKEALRLALAPSGSVHASVKSFNNHWGVPLTLANMPQSTAFGVFEAGMNHAGELTHLSELIRPNIAIVTMVGPVHLGFFASVEEIADAKGEIFAGLEPGGTAVLNFDSPYFEQLAAAARKHGARVVSFGESEGADARAISMELGVEGSLVRASILGQGLTYMIGAVGRHFVQNSLAVLATVKLAGAHLANAALALRDWHAQEGRGGRLTLGEPDRQIVLIDESYNANPASMRAGLAALGLTPREDFKRRVAVLGDMLELGEGGGALHRELADVIDEAGVDVVFACGELMAGLYGALPAGRQGGYARTAEDLAPLLIAGVAPGDVVMIKGSFGSRMAPLVEALKAHWNAAGITA